jgi:hypothetical protein
MQVTFVKVQQPYLLAEVLSALDIFGFGFVSLFSVLLSVREAVPRPRPVPLDPAPDISLKNSHKDVIQNKFNQEAEYNLWSGQVI